MASKEHTVITISNNFLVSAFKVFIVLASIAVASVAGFYVHPHLLPFLTHSLPQLYAAAHSWFTAPILFLLVNLVVGTIYFSSGFIQRTDQKMTMQPKEIGGDRGRITEAVSERNSEPDHGSVLAAPPVARPIGLRARIEEKSRPFRRLARSKSEQIVPGAAMKANEAGRLKKAGTFEVAAKGNVRKKEVVVADPADEEAVAAAAAAPPTAQEQEVDQKAEDFISRFYQKVKLQRLDSLLRKQGQQAEAGQSTN